MVSLQIAFLALSTAAAGDAVLYDFTADWCGPCRQMAPVVDQLAQSGYPIRKINIDQHRDMASQYGVQGIPCFVLVVDGKEAGRIVGATSPTELQALFHKAGIDPNRESTPTKTASNDQQKGGILRNAIDRIRNGGFGFGREKSAAETAPQLTEAPPFNPAAASNVSNPAIEPPGAPSRVAGQSPEASLPSATTATRPGATKPNNLQDQLMASSVRLRIDDGDGHSVGSGTIIDAREGEALILTCGHVFRDSKGKGAITVDMFWPRKVKDVPAQLIAYDLDLDLGLISFRPPVPVVVAKVAPAGYAVRENDQVTSIGCNHGADPTAIRSHVLSLNKFLGPANLQVAGQPVQGRSGGGLFSSDGLVVGVCNAADPADNQGLYAALPSVHRQLDNAFLSDIYRSAKPATDGELLASHQASNSPTQTPANGNDRQFSMLGAGNLPGLATAAPGPHEVSKRSPRSNQPPVQLASSRTSGLTSKEKAALAEIQNRSDRAEVVCVIRSLDEPNSKSEIIILDSASPEFLEKLAGEQRAQDARHLTSLNVRGPRTATTHQRPVANGNRTQAAGY